MLTSNVNDALITNEVEDVIPIENSCNSSGIAPMYGHHSKHFLNNSSTHFSGSPASLYIGTGNRHFSWPFAWLSGQTPGAFFR